MSSCPRPQSVKETLTHLFVHPFIIFLLQQCKLGIVKFIEAKQVPEVETVVHLVVASSDTRHSVATAADLELKSKQRWVKKKINKSDLPSISHVNYRHQVLHSLNSLLPILTFILNSFF